MTPAEQRLLAAAKWAKRYLEAVIQGTYHGPNEDIAVGRELAEAITAVELEQVQTETAA